MTKRFLLLFAVLVLQACTVTVNVSNGPQPYYQPQQAAVQPLQPAAYQEPQRTPRSIKAVQNRALTQQEFRTGDSIAEREARCGTYRPIDWECK